jgi:HSP20 family protein
MDLSKWNPFKFRRNREDPKSITIVRQERRGSENRQGTFQRAAADPWQMMAEMARDPWSSFARMDRWFGDFSPFSFTPNVDVVDDGAALRVSAFRVSTRTTSRFRWTTAR